jgi:pimeloyl-ACP methyl ester carboxylesterase
LPSLTLPDGGTIVYDDDDFSEPWRAAPPVVLVHGFSKNRRFWFEWIPALARRYRVLNVDLPGHGDSSLPPREFVMGLEPFADDLVAVLDGLGLPSATFVMAEFSSSVAIDLATRHPSRVKALVLPGFGYNWRASRAVDWEGWARTAEGESAEAWARQTNHLRLPPTADPALREWYVTQQARVPGWLLAKVFRFAATLDLTPRLGAVKAPTLVLTGSESQQDPVDSIRRGVKQMPNAELTVFPGAPLNVMNARPAESIGATLAFLERHA